MRVRTRKDLNADVGKEETKTDIPNHTFKRVTPSCRARSIHDSIVCILDEVVCCESYDTNLLCIFFIVVPCSCKVQWERSRPVGCFARGTKRSVVSRIIFSRADTPHYEPFVFTLFTKCLPLSGCCIRGLICVGMERVWPTWSR